LILDIPAGLQVHIQPLELQRVLSNLLENARRYGRSGHGQAQVELRAQRQGDWIALSVRDHGPGVPAAVLGRLTEPFFRADEARTAAIGSGLGLAIARKTVESVGGQLALAPAEGGGLQVTLNLPAA
jgi:two-component system, OmpR family, osmolarity sensor histidine kinase EnvZ